MTATTPHPISQLKLGLAELWARKYGNISGVNLTIPDHDTLLELLDIDYPSLEVVENEMQILLICVYSLATFLSLAGNITVITVLACGTRSSRELRSFLINLAVSDIIMALFCIPFTYTTFMLGRWVFYPTFCPIVIFMQHVAVTVSVYTLTAIGIDRYFAIMRPLKMRLTKDRSITVISCIWLVGIIFSSVQLYTAGAKKFRYDGQWHWECQEEWGSQMHGQVYTVGVFLLTFAIPMMGLGFTYTSVAWHLWRHNTPGNANAKRDQAHLRAKRKVIKMLVTVVVLFVLCWLPLHVFIIMISLAPHMATYGDDSQRQVYAMAYFFCHWLAMSNSFVNPIIYCFMSENFKADLKLVLFRLCGSLPICHKRLVRRPCSSVRSGSVRTTVCLLHRRSTSARSAFITSPSSPMEQKSPRSNGSFKGSLSASPSASDGPSNWMALTLTRLGPDGVANCQLTTTEDQSASKLI